MWVKYHHRKVLEDSRRGVDDWEQPQPRLKFDTAQQRRRSVLAWLLIRVRTLLSFIPWKDLYHKIVDNLVRPEPRPQSGAGGRVEVSI